MLAGSPPAVPHLGRPLARGSGETGARLEAAGAGKADHCRRADLTDAIELARLFRGDIVGAVARGSGQRRQRGRGGQSRGERKNLGGNDVVVDVDIDDELVGADADVPAPAGARR